MVETRSQDERKTCHQQAPNVQEFEHSSNRCVDEAKERRSSLKAFRNEPEHRRMLVNMILVCIELCVFSQ